MKLAIIAIMGLFLASCSRSQNTTSGQETPQLCLKKLHKAGVEEDRQAFQECFFPRNRYLPAIDAMFDYTVVTTRFGRKLESRFGIESWDDFDRANSGEGMTPLVPPWKFTEEWSKSRPIKIEGDSASVILFPLRPPLTGIKNSLILRDGQWFLDSAQMFPDPEGAAEFFKESIAEILRGIENLKEPSITLDEIKKRLGKEK